MHVKPPWLLDRDTEWRALTRFTDRQQRLAVVYGPRRVGKSYLLQALSETAGGRRYQAITGVAQVQLADLGMALGSWLGSGKLDLDNWADALDRITRLDVPVLIIDELPYLTEASPELPSLLQRHLDTGKGPALVLAGSSLSTMTDLVSARAPLYGRAAAVVIPAPFTGPDLAELWGTRNPEVALWVDAAVGGLPGYRPLLAPPDDDLDSWMIEEVLAPSSPLLDAAQVTLAEASPNANKGLPRSILQAIAQGEHAFNGIARTVGSPATALSRPLAGLERAGLLSRVPDPLRTKRDRYDLADPHLRMWLAVISPRRSQLQAGRAKQVWDEIAGTTWRSQVLGPRWETITRAHIAAGLAPLGPIDVVGATTVADPGTRTAREIDIIAMGQNKVVAIGEAKLRRLGKNDLDRLTHVRQLLGATEAKLILASATGIDADIADQPDLVTITPADVYSTNPS